MADKQDDEPTKLTAAERAASIPDLADYKDVETVQTRLHGVYPGSIITDQLAKDLMKFVRDLTKLVKDDSK